METYTSHSPQFYYITPLNWCKCFSNWVLTEHEYMGPKLIRAEGFILGIGAKRSTIAGPVIAYGASVSGLNNHIILKVGRGLAPAAKQKACLVWSSLQIVFSYG